MMTLRGAGLEDVTRVTLGLSLIHISEPTRLLSIGDGGLCV